MFFKYKVIKLKISNKESLERITYIRNLKFKILLNNSLTTWQLENTVRER